MPNPLLKIDRYEVLGQLGKGSNGIVYLAIDPRVGREVAIKVINPERGKDPVVQQRFHREAKAIARLHHPNIMQLLDYSGPNARFPYLVVERLHGKNLDEVLLERGQPLDSTTAAAVAHEICLALKHAHAHSIVHRDLKPENVFIEPEGRVVLCDFGIARSFADNESGTLASQNTRLAGSPLYMSPEQVSTPQSVGPASDIFALGSLLHYLLARQHCFLADTVRHVLKRIVSGEPASLREQRPGLPDRLYRIVDKLHEKDPSRRFANASAVADSLRLVLKDAGQADARSALKGALESLARSTAQLSRSQLIGVDAMDEEAKTVVVAMAPVAAEREPEPPQREPEQLPVAPVPEPEPIAFTADKPRATLVRGPTKAGQWTLAAALAIVVVAIIASLLLVTTPVPEKVPPPLPPPQPLPAVATGTLRLSVQPDAEVYVDDRLLGTSTTLGPMPLPVGSHRLLLLHAKLGRFEQMIEIEAGQDTIVARDLNKK